MYPRARAARALAATVAGAALAFAAPAPAHADVLTVTTTANGGPGSLRDSIITANGTAAADTIRFADGVRGTIDLDGSQIGIGGELTIEGPGARALTVSGGGKRERVFFVSPGATVTISGLTVADGEVFTSFDSADGASSSATGATGNAGGNGASGGVIGLPGAPGSSVSTTGTAGAAQVGAGILNQGTLTLREVTVTGNQVTAGNGGSATATAGAGGKGGRGGDGPAGGSGGIGGRGGNATATGGVGGRAQGAGIFNGGTLTLERSTVSFNRAVGGDGGAAHAARGPAGAGGDGGDNAGGGNGGNGGAGGTATATGGAAGDAEGAGIYNAGTLTVRSSTIAANVAVPGRRGLIASELTGGGAADGIPGASGGGSGGAGGLHGATQAAVGARGDDHGGGLTAAENTQGTLAGATIAGNDATLAANIENRGTVSLQSSIVAEPRGGGQNCLAAVLSLGHNIDSGVSCGLGQQGDHADTDPELGALRDNGGPTNTRAIAIGSSAVDQGVSAGNAADQRRVPRPSDHPTVPNAAGGDGTDIGAFEIPFVPDTTAPAISGAKASPKVGRRTTALVYTLSEAASVAHTIDQALPGRTVGGKCRPPTRANRNRRRCTRFRRIGSFTKQRPAGQTKQPLPSKVGGKKLGAGSFRATLAATDASNNRSARKSFSFRLTGR